MVKLNRYIGVTVLIITTGLFGFGAYMFMTSDSINDAYAALGAAEMVIDYMDSHHGKWPRSWGDLLPQFKQSNGRVGGWSFERFQSRVTIDFNSDPEVLRQAALKSSVATFDVIRPRHLFAAQMEPGPNQLLCNYFRNKTPNSPLK